MSYQIVANVDNPSTARVLVVALKTHGFHPLEHGEDGLPGVGNIFGKGGVPVQAPEEEADDARLLAAELLKEMMAGDP
ncbi:MAG: hypothetical protein MO852_12280 [Candidatus Devosia euplotis]|nr:hypothetical protein [Candidatus Devosia euplotis]